MPDERKHRGPHPEDSRLFSPESWPRLRQATADMCWLLSRKYARQSALKLVGDRYALVARQRIAVARSACGEAEAAARAARQVVPQQLAGCTLWLDGYNVLTTIEAALAGGIILAARDGAYRDMASMHGSYRKVAETLPALERLGSLLAALEVAEAVWYLDRPVSNSGRLKGIMEGLSRSRGWPWRVELAPDPDLLLIEATAANAASLPRPLIVATADSAILDRCGSWFSLARETVIGQVPEARVVDLSAM